MEYLNKDMKKRTDPACTSLVEMIKLLDITYKSYEFNANLIGAIN